MSHCFFYEYLRKEGHCPGGKYALQLKVVILDFVPKRRGVSEIMVSSVLPCLAACDLASEDVEEGALY